MIISLTFRNTEGEEWQRGYVEERLKKLSKYVDNPAEVYVVLSVEKFRNVVEINLISNGLNINAKEEDKDVHLAIDNTITKIERQLKKRKEKIRGHKTNARREVMTTEIEQISEDSDYLAGNSVVEINKLILLPMSLDDAVMEMDTTKNMFLVYRDLATEGINIMYRREDGKYALLETNG